VAELMAAELTHRMSWNPLATRGTALPPNVLLAAKLITLVFILLSGWRLTDPYLAFVGFMDDLVSPEVFQRTLQAVFLLAALSLFLNRFVRLSCGVLGGVIMIGLLSSHDYRENNITFTALLLLLICLSDRKTAWTVIRLQLVVLYFWAGANKLLDDGWRSGDFFETWNSIQDYGDIYRGVADQLPAMLLSATLSWGAILTELSLSAAFATRRLVFAGILVAVAYHSSLLLVTGRTFGMFWYAVLAACIALLQWPADPPSIRYGVESPLGRISRFLHRLDLARAFRWEPARRSELRLVIGEQVYSGRDALARAALYNPTLYFAFFALVAVSSRIAPPRWAALVVFGVVGYVVLDLVRDRFLTRVQLEAQ
jgi:hypothetical protein